MAFDWPPQYIPFIGGKSATTKRLLVIDIVYGSATQKIQRTYPIGYHIVTLPMPPAGYIYDTLTTVSGDTPASYDLPSRKIAIYLENDTVLRVDCLVLPHTHGGLKSAGWTHLKLTTNGMTHGRIRGNRRWQRRPLTTDWSSQTRRRCTT